MLFPRGQSEEDALGTAARMCAMAHRGDDDSLMRMLQYGCDVDLPDHNGRTALMVAISQGNTALSTLLMESGACCDLIDRRGFSARDYTRICHVEFDFDSFSDNKSQQLELPHVQHISSNNNEI